MTRSHYEVLGVRPDAAYEEIRAAYRALARQHHPDAQGSASAPQPDRSRRTMAELNAAWTVVGNPSRRALYDAELGVSGPRAGSGANRPSPDWKPFHEGFGHEHEDDLDDEPFGNPPPRQPLDSVVMAPVLLLLLAAAMFFFSTMVQSAGLRTASILMLPVSGLGFVAAPLFVMVRSRSRR